MTQSSTTDNAPEIQFNPISPEFTQDPEAFYAPIRERAPIFYFAPARFWVLTRHDDIATIVRDQRFTADPRAWRYAMPSPYPKDSELAKIFDHNPFLRAPEDHLRIRRLVSPAFSARAVARLEPKIREIADDLLQKPRGSGQLELDIAADYSGPMPIRAIATMFGIPRDQQEAFGRWGYALLQQVMLAVTAPDRLSETMAEAEAGVPMLRRIIAQRRREPTDDILSQLIHAQEAGDKLTEDELVSLVAIVIAAGTDTTVHLISFTVYNLLRREELRRQVQREPSILPSVIDEIMRFDSQSKATIPRYALEDLTLGGQSIAKGDLLVGYVGAAMRDPATWPDAHRFDITRDQASNLSFGRGAHHCLGSHLAKLECRVAVNALLESFPDMQLEGPPVYEFNHPIHRAISSLKVRLREG